MVEYFILKNENYKDFEVWCRNGGDLKLYFKSASMSEALEFLNDLKEVVNDEN